MIREKTGEIILYKNTEEIERKAWADIYKSASQETAGNLGVQIKFIETALISIVRTADILAMNRTLGFESAADLDTVHLKKIINEYRQNNIPRFFLQIRPDLLTAENTALLYSLGFSFYNNWTKLYRDDSPVKEVQSDLVVEQTGRTGAEAFAEIIAESFEWDEKLLSWFAEFVERDRWIHYIGYYKHKPAAAASLFIDGEWAWLGFASVLKEFRGMGGQQALIKQRLLDGINNGCRHFIVETAEDTTEKPVQSYLNLISMGFQNIYTRPNYIYKF